MKDYRKLTTMGVLTALSVILSLLELPIIPPPFHFLKLDFADVPILLSLLLIGPGPALVISVLRGAIRIFVSNSMLVGELANLLLDATFIAAYCIAARLRAGRLHDRSRMSIAAVTNIVLSVVYNFAIFIPLYKLLGMYPEGVPAWYYVAAGLLPLNLIKWPLVSVIAYWLGKPLRRFSFRKA